MITTGNLYVDLVAILFSLATIACFATKDSDPYKLAGEVSIVIGIGYFLYLGI